MKKWMFLLAVIVLIGYAATHHKPKADTMEPEPPLPPVEADHATDAPPPKPELTIDVSADQVHEGDLLLVNKDHPVPSGSPENEAVNLFQHQELLNGFVLLDNTIMLSPSLAGKFSTMVNAAAQEGVNHFMISSGYRDETRQNELYQQEGPDYAMPAGYSEHNLGLSLDIGSTQGEMNKAPEGQWLQTNASRYGFILRYPADKTAITGILFEPWHFRYVGLPHSAIMADKNMVLEEYLDYLKEQKTVTTTIDGQTYSIFYYPVSGDTTLHVPAVGSYEISGDNLDGVIVTVQA